MNFIVAGPFELGKNRRGLIEADAGFRKEYWEWVEEFSPGLPDACSCFVFTIQARRGSWPWYVGKAEKQSFRKECLTPHKINHFNNAIAGRRGTPSLFFLPQITRSRAYRKPTTNIRPAIQELESLLIGMALSRNSDLLNTQGTRMLKELRVDGFLNSPRRHRSGPAKDLRNV